MSEEYSSDNMIAITLMIIGGIVQSIGYIGQKKAHNDCNKEECEGSDIWFGKRLSWKIGIVIFLIGNAISAFSLNFGAQCILVPLMSLPLVWITILSACCFSETIIFEDFLAIIVIFFGIIMIVVFGPNLSISGQITVIQLKSFYSNLFFLIFVGAVTFAIIMDIICVKYTENKNYKSPNNRYITFGAHFLLFSYCIISAYFISIQHMFLKSIMSIIGSSIENRESFKINIEDWLTYFLILFYFVTMNIMELFRNRGLAYFGALYVLPIFEVWSLILSSCIGAIYFQELQGVEPFQGSLFFIGIIILSIGVIILAWDIGKILENISDYIAVAFVDENKVKYHHTKGLVFGGLISKLYQEYYFHRNTFLYNQAFRAYILTSTDQEYTDNEYDDSEDDLHIDDVNPLPIQQPIISSSSGNEGVDINDNDKDK